jgi:hypothetical protein
MKRSEPAEQKNEVFHASTIQGKNDISSLILPSLNYYGSHCGNEVSGEPIRSKANRESETQILRGAELTAKMNILSGAKDKKF